MPFPENSKAVETANVLVPTLKGIFGTPPGFRPAHAKGVLLTGTFTPSAAAASLSSAYHLNNAVPITARFSNSTGIPQIPDTEGDANPRGFAVRFHLPEENGRRVHTDIVTHSIPGFATRTGEDFVEFLQAFGASQNTTEKPTPIEKFLGKHPETVAWLGLPKPPPVSFGTEPYFGVMAFKLIAQDGKETFVRYQLVPAAGVQTLSDEEIKTKSATYHFDEIKERISKGPVVIKFKAQIAEEGDVTDDNTKHWPETRKVVELGEIKLDSILSEDKQAGEQKQIIFDPIPRIQGLAPSADPILDVRSAVYLISGKERRSA